MNIGKPVTESRLMMLKPVFAKTSSLIAQASKARGDHRRLCNQCTAFPSTDHLIEIKSQGRNVAKRSHFTSINLRSQSFTNIFDDRQRMSSGEGHDLQGQSKNAKGVHRNNSLNLSAQRCFETERIQIQR